MSLMDAKDKRIAELESLLKAALEEIARLKAEIALLKKHSGNSSKPPSSDIVKPKTEKKDKKIKRKKGAQPGHKQHLRTPIAPELLDEIVKLELTNCPDCQQQLDLVDSETKTFQQITLVEKPIVVTEYQQLMYWCQSCQCYHYAPCPKPSKRQDSSAKI